jgi:hypothetical protein
MITDNFQVFFRAVRSKQGRWHLLSTRLRRNYNYAVQRIAQPAMLVKQAVAFVCVAGEIPPKVLALRGYVINLF